MPILGSSQSQEEVPVYRYMHDNGGWDWFWMVPMMLIWIAVLGAVVYAAVRLALEHSHNGKPPITQ